MDNTQETITDIIAAKRREADFIVQNAEAYAKAGETTAGTPYDDCDLERDRDRADGIRRDADRLEAALRREKAAIEAAALTVGGIVGASRATAEKSSTVGDCAKLREALGNLRAELWNNTVIAGKRKFELYEIADAALAAPARNCDVGTAEDQTRRYEDYCRAHTKVGGCTGCPLADCRRCQIAWAQLPYTEGGAK